MYSFFNRRGMRLAVAAGMLLGLTGLARVDAAPAPAPDGSDLSQGVGLPTGPSLAGNKFTLHFGVQTNPYYVAAHPNEDWAVKNVGFGTLPMQRDIHWFYSHTLGVWPLKGFHDFLLDPTLMDKHRADIIPRLRFWYPDYQNARVMICINYEAFAVIWEDAKTLKTLWSENAAGQWEQAELQLNPHVFDGMTAEQKDAYMKPRYEAMAKKYFEVTMEECHKALPHAMFTFDNGVGCAYLLSPGVIGYGDHTLAPSQRIDKLQWLWDLNDFILVGIYQWCKVDDNTVGTRWSKALASPSDNAEYIRSNVAEGKRIARGKPVITALWNEYMSAFRGETISDANLRQAIEVSVAAGADGLAFWDVLMTKEEAEPWDWWLKYKVAPEFERVALQYRLDTTPSNLEYSPRPSQFRAVRRPANDRSVMVQVRSDGSQAVISGTTEQDHVVKGSVPEKPGEAKQPAEQKSAGGTTAALVSQVSTNGLADAIYPQAPLASAGAGSSGGGVFGGGGGGGGAAGGGGGGGGVIAHGGGGGGGSAGRSGRSFTSSSGGAGGGSAKIDIPAGVDHDAVLAALERLNRLSKQEEASGKQEASAENHRDE